MKRSAEVVLTLFCLMIAFTMVACDEDPAELRECFDRVTLWNDIEEHTDDADLRDELAASAPPAHCPAVNNFDFSVIYSVFEGEHVDSGPSYENVDDSCCYRTSFFVE